MPFACDLCEEIIKKRDHMTQNAFHIAWLKIILSGFSLY